MSPENARSAWEPLPDQRKDLAPRIGRFMMAIADDERERNRAIVRSFYEGGCRDELTSFADRLARLVQSNARLLMAAGAALALAMPPVAFAADDTATLKAQLNALTQQLKALAAQNAA